LRWRHRRNLIEGVPLNPISGGVMASLAQAKVECLLHVVFPEPAAQSPFILHSGTHPSGRPGRLSWPSTSKFRALESLTNVAVSSLTAKNQGDVFCCPNLSAVTAPFAFNPAFAS
jgi:hypothetical protein